MRINSIGYNHVHQAPFQVERPWGSGDYLLLLIKTSGLFILNGRKELIQPNSFILFDKGAPQVYYAAEETYANDWLHFQMDEPDLTFLKAHHIEMNRMFHFTSILDLCFLMKQIAYEKYSSNPFREESAQLYLQLLFVKLDEKIHFDFHKTNSPYYQSMSIIRSQIYSRPETSWTIDRICQELCISKSYFHHLYRQFFGRSAMEDIIQSRIEHAKHLLSSTTCSIREIAEMCGYQNDVHFMRQFKKAEGITPSEYRNSCAS